MEKINNITKIGVISDTHIPTRSKTIPNKVHELFNNVNLIIHCGDLVNKDVLIELEAIAPVCAVRGNMDPPEITLPAERLLNINDTITLCIAHGSGAPVNLKERLYKKFSANKPNMILYGHSHIPDNSEYSGVIMFNPGSAGHGLNYNSVGILNIENAQVKGEIIRF